MEIMHESFCARKALNVHKQNVSAKSLGVKLLGHAYLFFKYKTQGSKATKNGSSKHEARGSKATENASAKPEGAK